MMGTAVWLGQRDAEFLYSAEKRGLVDAKLLGRCQAVEGIAFEGSGISALPTRYSTPHGFGGWSQMQ
jgi:hypothetical protein